MVELATGLILAHILSDFIFQTEKMVATKRQEGWTGKTLILHTLGAGVLAGLLSTQWDIQALWIGVVTALSHYVIDGIKIYWERRYQSGRTKAFLMDQLAHLLVMAALVIWVATPPMLDQLTETIDLKSILVGLTGYIFLLKPASVLIQQLFSQWKVEQPDDEDHLPNAGAWIGYLERTLIFIFIMADTYTVIGFLIAAKSILRFRESSKKRQITEYVLLGTLLSFTLAIVISVFTRYIIEA